MQIVVFCLFQGFAEKEYQMESKRSETFARVIFGTISTQKTWSTREGTKEAATWVQGAPPPTRRAPHPRGPPLAPPMPSFLLYISMYPENIKATEKTQFHRRNLLFPWDPIFGPFPVLRRRGIRSRRACTSTLLPLWWCVSILPQTYGSIASS